MTKPTTSGLFALIEHVTPDGGQWCTIEKASALAAIVVALRPRVIVEIGVFLGGSLVPLALAQHSYALPAREVCWAVDPWQAQASVVGQAGENAQWWGRLDHESVYQRFVKRLETLHLTDLVQVVRRSSDEFSPPAAIDLLHLDGNHGEQALRDVERFAPRIPVGGILVLDDLNWEGGHVRTGHERACAMGFTEIYSLGTGCVMRRDSSRA